MTTQKLVCFAVIAGLGLSACSNTPKKAPETTSASIPEAGALSSPNAQLPEITNNPPVARALDLSYNHHQQRVPQALPQHYQLHQPATARPQHYHRARPQHMPRAHLVKRHNNGSNMPTLSKAELRAIGQQIFVNEGGGNMNRLVHWNVGEDFAAMGIGHFTWYPAGRKQRFGNTFPGLLDYMVSKGVQLPGWLKQARHTGSPWRSRSDFLRHRNSTQVKQLQQLLYNTREIQAEYIVNRARRAMPKLVKASNNKQHVVARNLNAVANTPGGWYALIDYVNFKGEGLVGGGYKGQSWGLRQVLEEMRPSQPGQQALNEFADAAMRVLQRRVRNSDPSRNEKRWLRGWRNRVNTYRNPIV